MKYKPLQKVANMYFKKQKISSQNIIKKNRHAKHVLCKP